MANRKKAPGLEWNSQMHAVCFYALVTYIFLEFARPQDQYSFIPKISLKMTAIVMLGSWVMTLGAGMRPNLQTKQFKWLAALVALMAWTIPFSYLKFYSWGKTEYMIIYIVLIIVVASTVVTTRAHLRRFLEVFSFAVGFVAVQGARFYVIGGPSRHAGVIAGSFLGDENDFALFLCCFFPLALYLAVTETKKRLRFIYYALFATSVMTVLGTFSRGGLVTMGGMTIYLFIAKPQLRVRVLQLAVVGLIAALAFLPKDYWDSFSQIWQTTPDGKAAMGGTEVEFEDGSLQGRWEAWQAAINMALDKPLWGVGAANFNRRHHVYRPAGARHDREAHSVYFELLGELGFPGIIWLLSLFAVNIRTTHSLEKEALASGDMDTFYLASALETSVAAFYTGGAFLSVAYYPFIHWIGWMIGMTTVTTVATAAMVQRAAPEKSKPARPRFNVVKA